MADKQKMLNELENELLHKEFVNAELTEELKRVQNEFASKCYELSVKAELLKKQKEATKAKTEKEAESLESENRALETKIGKLKNTLHSILEADNKNQSAVLQCIEAEQTEAGLLEWPRAKSV